VLLVDLIAPPRCLACGTPGGDPLCAACRDAIPWLRDACPRCALPRPCAPCPARGSAFSRALAVADELRLQPHRGLRGEEPVVRVDLLQLRPEF